MQQKQKEKSVSITSEVPEEETEYPIYSNNGTISVPISGNGNTVYMYIMNGKPPSPPPPPGGGQ